MIDESSPHIALPRYADTGLTKMMQKDLAEASQDDLLAAFIWSREEKRAWQIICALEHWQTEAEEEGRRARLRASGDHMSTDFWASMREDWQRGIGRTAAKLEGGADRLSALAKEARAVHEQLIDVAGDFERYTTVKADGEQILDESARLYGQGRKVMKAVSRALREERDDAHRLVVFNAECRAYMASSESISLRSIDALHHSEFEEWTAWLLQRDGYKVQRGKGGSGDLGADVIAVSPSGQRVVVQCKHMGTPGRSVGSDALQRLNGTARDIHGADIVIMVTNGGVSKPARLFAEDQRIKKIHLIDRAVLQRWATWGRPVGEILDLPEPDTDSSAA
ncbi:restriction endonuclease [Streptomyces tsukubensis]|uniref:restriction endonuclease n=1 Tax=Streptomyces tsukubensis TaxID=83656 RepID=UPI003450903B